MNHTLRKIQLMHAPFGRCEGRTCAECRNLAAWHIGRAAIHKCRVYGENSSTRTDWKKRWTACGEFDRTHQGGPVLHRMRRADGKTARFLDEERKVKL